MCLVRVYGVFGELKEPLENEELPLVQTVSPDEVKKGKAQIITVLDGETPEWFSSFGIVLRNSELTLMKKISAGSEG